MKKSLFFILLLILNYSFSQNINGYWDTNRKTSSIIKLSKGQLGHLEVKLPKGTTEIAYRIVPTSKYIGALDDFSEALKNSGNSKALAAGYTASFISKLSGDVKCRYGIFNNIQSINNFYTNSDFSTGCHFRYDIINKYEVNVLRKEDSPCLFNSPSTIWFAFKSENYIFDQDVIVEVIPWVQNSNINETQLNSKRQEAFLFSQQNDFINAIRVMNEIIDSGLADSMDYNSIGWYYILTRQYFTAEKFLKIGEQLDGNNLFIKGNLAHVYLLTGDSSRAKSIYVQYKNTKLNEQLSWLQMIESDFNDFKKRDIYSIHFDSILASISN